LRPGPSASVSKVTRWHKGTDAHITAPRGDTTLVCGCCAHDERSKWSTAVVRCARYTGSTAAAAVRCARYVGSTVAAWRLGRRNEKERRS
jgi:hypothetical protein